MRKKLQDKLMLFDSTLPLLNMGRPAAPSEPKPIADYIARLIVERSAGLRRPESFGTADDVNVLGFESLLPALVKAEIPDSQPRIRIGGKQCAQPYEASVLNCSALSFGPMGKNFILALNRAARQAGFFQNTGEAGISPYHFNVDVDVEAPEFSMEHFVEALRRGDYPEAEQAGDVVWQIGTGYFGCRRIDGSFDPDAFREKATLSNVKMIEVKLSQGVEPRKEMPVKQVTTGMAKLMGIKWGMQAKLQDEHSSFSSPVELLKFVRELRTLSDGKPIGLKIGVSHRQYFLAICKAMLKTGIRLDFITVDGMEAGTAAAAKGALGYTGTSLSDAVLFVHNALVGTRLRSSVKIIASGRMFTEQDILHQLARGADLCANARGMMLAVGCDQQRECYNGNCQMGIATQDPHLLARFDIAVNTRRLANYHQITIQELKELLSIAGVTHPSQIGPFHLQKRVNLSDLKPLDEVYEFLAPGALLSPFSWQIPPAFRRAWRGARADEPFADALSRQIKAITR